MSRAGQRARQFAHSPIRTVIVALAVTLLSAQSVFARDAAVPAAKPKTYALVAAFGDRLTYVYGRPETGSRLEPYRRTAVPVQDDSLNSVILNSLDAAVAKQSPSSRRIHLSLDPGVLREARPTEQEQRALAAVLSTLQRMPERDQWDEILVVTPTFLLSEEDGLAPRLHGAGVYFQPVESGVLIVGPGERWLSPDHTGAPIERVVSPNGFEHTSRVYVAVHYFARLRRYDARTLELLYTEVRFESVKLHDPMSDSVYLSQSIPTSVLNGRLTAMVEQSTAAAARRAMGVVEVGPLRPADPAPGAPPSR